MLLTLAVFASVATDFTSAALSVVVCKTEIFPIIAGNDSKSAETINVIAAPIVIRDKTDCVPRGPKAVLETLLVNNAPASVLPGCKSTVTINTKKVKGSKK